MTRTHPLVGVFAPAGQADVIALTAHDGGRLVSPPTRCSDPVRATMSRVR